MDCENLMDCFLASDDYNLVMCALIAEVITAEMPEKYRELRMEAISRLNGILHQYANRMYCSKLLAGIARKKGKMILEATTKADMERILHPHAPHYDGNQFVPDPYGVAEEELICWSETSLRGPLIPEASARYRELFREVFPEESKQLAI